MYEHFCILATALRLPRWKPGNTHRRQRVMDFSIDDDELPLAGLDQLPERAVFVSEGCLNLLAQVVAFSNIPNCAEPQTGRVPRSLERLSALLSDPRYALSSFRRPTSYRAHIRP